MTTYDQNLIKNYRQHPGVNYSLLSQLSSGVEYVGRKKFSDALTFGSLVDTKLFTPELESEQFVIMGDYQMSEQMKLYADTLIAFHKEAEITQYADLNEWKEAAREKAGFKISVAQLDKKFEGDCKNYVNFILSNQEKTPISPDVEAKAQALAVLVKNHPYSMEWFGDPEEGTQILYQYPVYFPIPSSIIGNDKIELEGKALLDIVKINHKEKTVLPIDFKTIGSPVKYFMGNYFKYKYYYQDEWYWFALDNAFGTNTEDSYNVHDMSFLVASSESSYPVLYHINKTDAERDIIWEGGIINGYRIRGIVQLIRDYVWHLENGFEIDREIAENGGKLTIPFTLE